MTSPTATTERLSPAIVRITAPNPSAYTHTGTQTYVVGDEAPVVIDPGPDLPQHLRTIDAVLGGRVPAAILITHNHRDHSPAAVALAAATGAPVLGGPPVAADRSYDTTYRPARVLADGEAVAAGAVRLVVVATPGHTSNHLCFALEGEGALFTGDHAMGWSTSVVIPPDGDMGAYMRSLDRLAARDDRVFYPGHGDTIADPPRWLRATIGHRRMREAQILRLTGGALTGEAAPGTEALVASMYPGLGPTLRGAAAHTVLAHLIDLRARGLVDGSAAGWRRVG